MMCRWLFISWHTSLATGTYILAGCCNNILRADVSCPHSKSRPWLSLRDLTRIKKQKNAVMTRKRKNARRLSLRVQIRVQRLTIVSWQIVRNLHCKLMNTFKNVLSLYDLFMYMCLCIFSWYRLDPARTLIGQKPIFYQSINHRKSVFYCFPTHFLYIIKEIKKPKQCITLW